MHTLRNRILLFGGTLAAGLMSLGLHRYMMEYCFDDKGLLLEGNLPEKLLWAVGIGFVALLVLVLRTIGGDGTYTDSFPPCYLSGGLMIAAALAMVWAIPGLVLTVQPPVAEGMSLAVASFTGLAVQYLPWAAAVSMAVLGVYRMLGRRPWPIFGGIICAALTRWCKLKNRVAVGIAMGASSHAIGTAKAIEMGETEGAMSGLAIALVGTFTVIFGTIIPWGAL